MCFPLGPADHFFGFRSVFHPCFIRGSRISCFATFRDECSIGGERTSPTSVPHFLAKPKVRPLLSLLEEGPLAAVVRQEGTAQLFEQGKKSVAVFRRRFIIIDANPKKLFELATE